MQRLSNDVQKAQYSHCEWQDASPETKKKLDSKVKEPGIILFFKGVVYEFTFNSDGNFSQSQACILHELPLEDDVQNWRKIPVLAAPPGVKDIEYDESKSIDDYVAQGWKVMKVGTAPETTKAIGNHMQAQRRQYGLRHCVTATTHARMGDTLSKVALELNEGDLWDKAQVVVALSCTKLGKHTILVGRKEATVRNLISLIKSKNQWTDYMEDVLNVVTVGCSELQTVTSLLNVSQSFPFRICDIELPMCKTGFVYMLLSCRRRSYSYIGQTMCLVRKINQHNSGYGASGTTPFHLCPFGVIAYICGFDRNWSLMLYVERKWKIQRDELIGEGSVCPKQWALSGSAVVADINPDNFNAGTVTRLRLVVCLSDS